jgi:hypothetical protein
MRHLSIDFSIIIPSLAPKSDNITIYGFSREALWECGGPGRRFGCFKIIKEQPMFTRPKPLLPKPEQKALAKASELQNHPAGDVARGLCDIIFNRANRGTED